MLVADLDYSDYLGRLAVGRIMHGSIYANESLACIGEDGQARPCAPPRSRSMKACSWPRWTRPSPATSWWWPASRT